MLALLRGRPGVVRADLQNGRIVLELAESADIAPLVALIVQNGGQVEEVRKDKGSLEDVFLTLMEEERVIRDVLTVAWKEWRELLQLGGSLRGGRFSLVILLGVFGVFLPLQAGAAWVQSPATVFYWGWVPLMLVGERRGRFVRRRARAAHAGDAAREPPAGYGHSDGQGPRGRRRTAGAWCW